MTKAFEEEFAKFQAKIQQFRQTQMFDQRKSEYEQMFNQMASVAPDDMKHYIEKSERFLPLRNRSLELMEQIVRIHSELAELFESDAEALGQKCDFQLEKIDREIAEKLKEVSKMLKEFEYLTEEGSKIIKIADDPFLSQGM